MSNPDHDIVPSKLPAIDGQWQGHFTYGEGYTPDFRKQKVRLELNLINEGGNLQGTALDSVTRGLFREPAQLVGRVEGDSVAFIKRYPCLVTVDESGNSIVVPEQPSTETIFSGKLKKKLFSSKYFLQGEWKIEGSFINQWGTKSNYTYRGTWSVEKVR